MALGAAIGELLEGRGLIRQSFAQRMEVLHEA
jgi:hypothetical protein